MRAFRIVYAVLAVNFLIPTAVYGLAPDVAMAQFNQLNHVFGGAELPAEVSVFWRVLGVANVGTLGFCCALIWWDLRRWYPVVVPLFFLKGFDALNWGIAWASYREPAYGVATLLDFVTMAAIWYFPMRARRELSQGELPPG